MRVRIRSARALHVGGDSGVGVVRRRPSQRLLAGARYPVLDLGLGLGSLPQRVLPIPTVTTHCREGLGGHAHRLGASARDGIIHDSEQLPRPIYTGLGSPEDLVCCPGIRWH